MKQGKNQELIQKFQALILLSKESGDV